MKALKKIPMTEIRAMAKGHCFDREAMRFFSTTLPQHGYIANDGAVFFASGEQFLPLSNGPYPRRYSVRRLDPETRFVDTVGEFQQYETLRAATLAARELATKEQ